MSYFKLLKRPMRFEAEIHQGVVLFIDCILLQPVERSEDEDEIVIDRRKERNRRRSPRIPSNRRQIARTIVSERVWAAIATNRRGRRRIESDSDVSVTCHH